jgi:hypothetical protein
MNGDHPTAGDYAMAEAQRNSGYIARLEDELRGVLRRLDDLELAVVQLAEQDGEVSFTPRKDHE